MDYEDDDEYEDNSENLNYLDLINNSQSFEETIRNFKNGINRVRKRNFFKIIFIFYVNFNFFNQKQTSEMSEENENETSLYKNNNIKNGFKRQDSET